MHRVLSLISTVLATCVLLAAAPTSAAPGDMDTTFGSGSGMVRTAIGTGDDRATAIALQPDGKIVVAGYCSNGSNYDFCLARYHSNGTLDSSFDSDGMVTTPIGLSNDQAYAIALQPDGKIVVAGYCSNGNNDFCLARYHPNGALDSSFDSDGTVITSIGPFTDNAYAIALQPDGKIVVAGACSNGSDWDFCVARYHSNGALDSSFNSTGTVITSIGSSDDIAQAIALQPDGKIIVAGYCGSGSNKDFCLARYHTNGALDFSFDSDGMVITPIGSSNDFAQAIALQPDGKIVVAGHCWNGSNWDFCLARYHSNGTLDSSFDSDGKVTTPIGSSNDEAYAIALQPDGKIVVSGACKNGSDWDFCLARYHPNGALDFSFDSDGKVTTPIGSFIDEVHAIALQPDGKIVVAGYCLGASNSEFCLARYQGGPFGYQNCKLDIDGDGVVLATTDALIHARVALGMTGSAVIRGVGFASHATRKTWPAIRDYLVGHCGMRLAP